MFTRTARLRRVAVLVIVALGCSKPQPKADSVASAAPTSGASPAVSSTQLDALPEPRTSTSRAEGGPIAATKTAPRPAGLTNTTTRAAPQENVIIGRVSEQGTDAVTFLAVIPASGAQVRVSGRQIAALGNVKGADIWARGRQDVDGFVVDTFEVRQVNDRSVEDGIVSVAGTTVTVRTARATLTYPDAAAALRNAAGARVWITPPVAGQAPSFGIIRPATRKVRG